MKWSFTSPVMAFIKHYQDGDGRMDRMRMSDRLRQALSSGALVITDSLDESGDTLARILDLDSLDLVELVMAMDEKGMKADTVGDLMRFLDEIQY
jgi:hypothetical protein